MVIKLLLNRYEYNNFLKGKYIIGWYIIRSKTSYLSSFYVNDKTNQFNEILYHLLNVMSLKGTKQKNEPMQDKGSE